jgi:hypothetical protein
MPRYSYTRETYVDPYPGREDSELLSETPCSRCGGDGGFDHYLHVDKGICFRCDGDPEWRERWYVSDARKEAKRQVNATNKFRMERAKAEVKWAEGIAELTAVRAEWGTLTREQGILDYNADDCNEFVIKLAGLIEQGKTLTERQAQAGADAIDKYNRRAEIEAAKAAAKAAVPAIEAGRVTLTGVVKAHKLQEGDYGDTWKMIVEDAEGRRYWGTIPQSIWNDMEARDLGYDLDKLHGLTVTMTATVEPSRDDHTFGFYSRPTKATIK